MNARAQKIKSRCYWQAVIRPRDFEAMKVANRHVLSRVVRGATVTYQGFDFPHFDASTQAEVGADWIGQSLDWGQHLELWRAYLSGQFYHLLANDTDWGSARMLSPFGRLERGEPFVGVGYALFQFTVVFEFAARLALTEMGAEQMHVEMLVGNLDKHRLVSDDPNRGHMQSRPTAGVNEYLLARDVTRTELAAEPRILALSTSEEFFHAAFDEELPRELLKGWQEQWLRR